MRGDRHWVLKGNKIGIYLNDGHFSPIATIENERAVRQLLRYADMAQGVEQVCDHYVGAAFKQDVGISDEKFREDIAKLVAQCIHDVLK